MGIRDRRGICLGLQLFFERGHEGGPADEGAVADGNAPEQADGPWVDGLGIMLSLIHI